MTKKQEKQQIQSNPIVLQYISGSEKNIEQIYHFLKRYLELYGNTLVRKKHLDNLASELSLRYSEDIKFRRDLERLRLIERYKKINNKLLFISIYDREWLKTKPDHIFKISKVGELIAKSTSIEDVRKYIVVSFLSNEIMSKIMKKMVGVIAIPIEQAIREVLAESINEAKDEKIKTKFVQLLNNIPDIIKTIEKLSKICPDIIKLEKSASGTLIMRVNLLTVRGISRNMLAYPEIDVKRYAECLTSAVAEFWKDYAEYILSGEWQAIPDTPLEQIYKKINELLGVELDINRHVELCKKLANLGYITYSYGGISIVKGKQAERHWINLKSSLYQRLKERLQKITQDF